MTRYYENLDFSTTKKEKKKKTFFFTFLKIRHQANVWPK